MINSPNSIIILNSQRLSYSLKKINKKYILHTYQDFWNEKLLFIHWSHISTKIRFTENTYTYTNLISLYFNFTFKEMCGSTERTRKLNLVIHLLYINIHFNRIYSKYLHKLRAFFICKMYVLPLSDFEWQFIQYSWRIFHISM